jgi:hypothetical protein
MLSLSPVSPALSSMRNRAARSAALVLRRITTMMPRLRFVPGQLKEVVPVAGQKHAIIFMSELKNRFVGRIFWKYFPQQHDFMRKFFE